MLAAAGGLIAYLDHAGRGTLPLLLPPVARAGEAHLAMDEATRASLEILASSQGSRKGSLIDAVDRCVTGAGARQLAEDLSAPLTDAGAIDARLELVQWLHDDAAAARGSARGAARAARCRPGAGPGGRRARQPARSRPAARRADRGAAACTIICRRARIAPRCSTGCCPASAGMAR